MSVATFMALPDDQPLPPHQDLRDRGLLVKRNISMKDVVAGKVASDTAAVSHRWDTPSHPDPQCNKVKKLKSVLVKKPWIQHLWMDYICAPQWLDGRRTPEEEEEFRQILSNILPYKYLGATVFVLYERIYGQRFWPCVETWVSTKTPTKNGLEPSPQSRMRTHFFGMLSMDGQDKEITTFMLSIWRKMPTQQAIVTLSKDDILVTNAKDKELNLKILGELGQTIQMLFEDADEDAAFDSQMAQLSALRTESDMNIDVEESQKVHKQIKDLKERELARLNNKIDDAAQRRDYEEAERIKERLAHVASFEPEDAV